MINFDGKELQEEFNKAFGNLNIANFNSKEDEKQGWPVESYVQLTIDKLTLDQLWWLSKFAKHVRGRCRNNAAFNNFMNRNFAPARFTEVPKVYNDRHFMGLKITVGNDSVEEDSE